MPTQLPYLPSNKNLDTLFSKIQAAKVPDKFTHSFLQTTMGLKGTADRSLIPLLRVLGFIDQSGTPLHSYRLLKSKETAKKAIGQAVRTAYASLFEADENVHSLPSDKLKGLIAQVAGTDEDMTARIGATFTALTKVADLSIPVQKTAAQDADNESKEELEDDQGGGRAAKPLRPEFHYNIQVHLPSNATEEIYLGDLQCFAEGIPMTIDSRAALFVMLGQTAERTVAKIENVVPQESLLLSPSYDLAPLLPDHVRRASVAARTYRLFFVFENFLRDFVVEVLSKDTSRTWWDKVPKDVQDEVTKLEETEEIKSWMALGSRDKSALLTFAQLLRIIEHAWKDGFADIVRDKGLIQEARLIGHLRNTICHMTDIPDEETDRVRQTIRDWFRVVAP